MSNPPRIRSADIEAAIEASIARAHYFTAAQGVFGAATELRRAEDQAAPLTLRPMTDEPQIWRAGSVSPLHLLTFCVLELTDGRTITGQSAGASTQDFDAAWGRRRAREDAVGQLWVETEHALRKRAAAGQPPAGH